MIIIIIIFIITIIRIIIVIITIITINFMITNCRAICVIRKLL